MSFKKNVSGQQVYFTMVSAVSGNAVYSGGVGSLSGKISGYVGIDGAAITGLTGPIVEDGWGQYHLNGFAADFNGNNLGFLFVTSSGVVPVSLCVVTVGGISGALFPTVPIASISGVNSVVPISTISGVITNSGLFVTVPPSTLSGVVINSGASVSVPPATLSGVFASVPIASVSGVNAVVPISTLSGVITNSGLFVNAALASGQVWLSSGQAVSLNSGQQVVTSINLDKSGYTAGLVSGLNYIASGHFTNVPPATLSGVVINSGAFVSVPPATLSGVFASVPISTLSGVVPASGAFVNASLNSGQKVLMASGQLSGQRVDANVVAWAGDTPSVQLAGTLPAMTTAKIYSIDLDTAYSINAPQGLQYQLEAQSGRIYPASGAFVTVPPSALSGVVPASGAFVNATATINSGASVSIASGTLTRDAFGSGVLSLAIPQGVLRADVSGFQSGCAVNSLLGTVLKLTSRFDVSSNSGIKTYQTDGLTPFMMQGKTINSGLKPIQAYGVGVAP